MTLRPAELCGIIGNFSTHPARSEIRQKNILLEAIESIFVTALQVARNYQVKFSLTRGGSLLPHHLSCV